MSSRPPGSDDALAALAKAAQRAVRAEDASRAAAYAAKEAGTEGRRRRLRAVSIVLLVVASIAVGAQGRHMIDVYHGHDPLADAQRAEAYLAALLDLVSEWRAGHSGDLPTFLAQAVPQSRLLPPGSAYRLDYRIQDGVPVLTLEGGRIPVVVRGTAR